MRLNSGAVSRPASRDVARVLQVLRPQQAADDVALECVHAIQNTSRGAARLQAGAPFPGRSDMPDARDSTMPSPPLTFVMELLSASGARRRLADVAGGRRRVIPILGGTFAGPGLRGAVLEGGADWQIGTARRLHGARYAVPAPHRRGRADLHQESRRPARGARGHATPARRPGGGSVARLLPHARRRSRRRRPAFSGSRDPCSWAPASDIHRT